MKPLRFLFCMLLVGALTACEQNEQATVNLPKVKKTTPVSVSLDASAFASYLELKVYTDVSMASHRAQELDAKISALLYNPNKASLEDTQLAWRHAYDAFLKSLIFAYLPINDPPEWKKKGISYHQTLTLIDTWPIEGGYIDYLDGYPFSGIVNDLALNLNADTLNAQHGFADPSYASLGFHPLEFILWGEDGHRSPRDFLAQDNTSTVLTDEEATQLENAAEPEHAQNNHRRRQFTLLVSEQLQKHLHRLQSRWEPSNGYYAKVLQSSSAEQVLKATFIATQKLISDELLSRRLTGDSSVFSQTSWADSAAIIKGVQELYFPLDNDGKPVHGGLASLNADINSKDAVIIHWQEKFDAINLSIEQWQQQQADPDAARKECRLRLIEFLSLLKQTAGTMNIQLPALE